MFKKYFFLKDFFLILTCLLSISLLILFALKNNVNLFYSPEEVFFSEISLIGKEIKIGGIVKPGSVMNLENLNVKFIVTDYKYEITVLFTGILPDLFRDHQGVIVTGNFIDKFTFQASYVFAKHDEKYLSLNVKH